MTILATSPKGWKMAAQCVAVFLALLLCAAPVIESVKHGPAIVVAEAEHAAFHVLHDHSKGHGVADHHNSGDHEHVVTDLILVDMSAAIPPLHSYQRPACLAADGTLTQGLRRPPRAQLV
jgi:hypothetical protein